MFQILSGQGIIMFLMILVGYVIYRTHLTDHDGNRVISGILLMVVTPAVLLDAMISMRYSPEVLRGFFLSIVLGFLSHLVVIPFTQLMLGRKRLHPEIGMERYLAVYSNCGFMGIPLVSAVFGQEAVIYVTGYMIAFNILTWTHGLIQITGETSLRHVLSGLLSPTVLCVLIGIVIFVFRIRIEAHVAKAIWYIGSMNTPMGMIVAGTALAQTGLRGIWRNPRLFLVTALKLLVAPAVTFVMLLAVRRFLPLTDAIFYALLIPAACPCATTGMMMALRYDKDYEFASQVFVVSTLLSMLTIPVLISLARMIAG